MKSFFYSAVFVAISSVATYAQSLYDLAMPIGLEESVPLKWNAYTNFGYDDNVNSRASDSFGGKQSSAYVSLGAGASLANYDSRTQYSFDVNLGLICYLERLYFGAEQVMSNSTVNARLTHHFDNTMSYSASVSLAWQPEPNYQTGISSARRNGDYFYVYLSNSLSKAWNTRYSTTCGINGSLIAYQEDAAKDDNRDYASVFVNNRYKWTERMALSLNLTGTYCNRQHGYDDQSVFVMGGIEYALSATTTATLLVGPQFKFIDSTFKCYPSVEGAINHNVSDRLSVRTFVRYANESNDTYYGDGNNFRSNESWRVGAESTWQFTPRWSVNLGCNFISSRYSSATSSAIGDYTQNTFNVNTGINLKLTESLTASLTYSFTRGQYQENGLQDYNRNVVSVGASYAF